MTGEYEQLHIVSSMQIATQILLLLVAIANYVHSTKENREVYISLASN